MQILKFSILLSILFCLYCGDKEPPIVEITNPSDGSYVSGTVLVTAEADDNKEVDSVKIYIDDSLVVGFQKAYAYYQWHTDSLLHNSMHCIYATASDVSRNIGVSETISVTVQHPGTLKWRYYTGSVIESAPCIGEDGTIYFGSGGYFYALKSNGTCKWCYNANHTIITSSALSSDGTVFFMTATGLLYALNLDGTLRWCYYQIGGGIDSSPTVAPDGSIYFGADDGYLYAINGSSPLATTSWPKFRHDLKNTGRAGGY